MSPDSDISRLARLEQRVEDLDSMFKEVTPIGTKVAVVEVGVQHLAEAVSQVRGELKVVAENLEERDKAVTAERRATRTALWSLVGVLGASLITAIGAILAAVLT